MLKLRLLIEVLFILSSCLLMLLTNEPYCKVLSVMLHFMLFNVYYFSVMCYHNGVLYLCE